MTDTPSKPAASAAASPAASFALGDVVRLKSGGPKMTILALEDAETISCKWFDRNGKVHKDSFTTAMVEAFIKQW